MIIQFISFLERSNLKRFIALFCEDAVLDNKSGVWEDRKVRERVSSVTISSGIFRELSEKVILDIQTSDENKINILRSLSECMAKSYQGQKLDLESSVDNVNNFKDDKEFLHWYLIKSKLQSGFLYGFSAKLGAILAQATEKQIEKAEQIGQIIGLGVHMSNDLGDFAVADETKESTGFKLYQDQMADLKNGRLTLPIYYVLKYGTEAEREALLKVAGNNNATREELVAAAKTIHSSGAFEFGKKFIRRYYKKSKNLIHKSFSKSEDRDVLSAMPGIIISNKYLTLLKNIR